MINLEKCNIQIFADGASIEGIRRAKKNPLIKGFTTNPTLMRSSGVIDYKKFAEEVSGAKKIRFLPDYYPFTEPIVQIDVWSEKLNKWVEFGGAGIFRPELTNPLGINQPVIAWGLGVDRMFQQRIKSKDIRELFSDDLKWLREVKDANN